MWPQELPLVRKEIKPISPGKYDDIQKLLKWTPPCFHSFHQNIPKRKTGAWEKETSRSDALEDIIPPEED